MKPPHLSRATESFPELSIFRLQECLFLSSPGFLLFLSRSVGEFRPPLVPLLLGGARSPPFRFCGPRCCSFCSFHRRATVLPFLAFCAYPLLFFFSVILKRYLRSFERPGFAPAMSLLFKKEKVRAPPQTLPPPGFVFRPTPLPPPFPFPHSPSVIKIARRYACV